MDNLQKALALLDTAPLKQYRMHWTLLSDMDAIEKDRGVSLAPVQLNTNKGS